ncbi:dihydrofolate reductase [Candidatus Roizmanbacteria bacterium]|nr:dihydrofolate reductase [Candidatus Roizmanbacteria bacterium]
MKVVVVMVETLNGKITKGVNPDVTVWTSKEDQRHFQAVLSKHSLIVMGSKTFAAARKQIKLEAKKLRVVLTRDPEKYKKFKVTGQLEFTSESPQKLVSRMKKKGYKTMLVVGGGEINSLFFKTGLVDELYLTIEPKIFGEGRPLVSEEELDISLRLLSIKKLNSKGTLLLKYSVNS